jgi:flagellar protein FliT
MLIIEDYQCLSDLTGKMLKAAIVGEWDSLVMLEKDCAQKIAEIKPRDTMPSDNETRLQKIALIKKILADDADIRNHTEVWMGQLQRIMQSARSEVRLQQAYNPNS